MKNVLILVLVIFTLVNANMVFAMSGLEAGSVNKSLSDDLRIHEILTRQRNNALEMKKTKPQNDKLLEQASLSDIKSVTFINNSTVSTQELNNIIQNYINQPMNIQNISAIQKEVMKYYQGKGYYSAVATVSSENLKKGELVLNINEGTKNSITVQP